MSGLAPAPSPLVSRAPSWSLSGARFRERACESVLAAMNSTPCSPSSIMVLMALPPPPPTPNTLMTAWQRFSSTIVNILDLLSFPDMRASSFPPIPVSEELRQISPDPPPAPPLLRHVAPRHHVLRRPRAVKHQPHGGGAGGAVDD